MYPKCVFNCILFVSCFHVFSPPHHIAPCPAELVFSGAADRNSSATDPNLPRNPSDDNMGDHKVNSHFMKKIPKGAEASNILVGEVDFLEKPLSAFIRLQEATILGDLTEVDVPTRFLFVLLGPFVS